MSLPEHHSGIVNGLGAPWPEDLSPAFIDRLREQGVAVADLFLDDGLTIVEMRGRSREANQSFVDAMHVTAYSAAAVGVHTHGGRGLIGGPGAGSRGFPAAGRGVSAGASCLRGPSARGGRGRCR
jgi:hypothetical protein